MTSRVVVAIRVACSCERAFEAFTGEIGAWWRPGVLFQTTPRAPGLLAFDPGPPRRLVETLASGRLFELGRVPAWSPPTAGGSGRLAFDWRQASFPPDLVTTVEVAFEPVGSETRVTVTHAGFDAVPADNAARHGFPDDLLLRRLAEWWRANLASLEQAHD